MEYVISELKADGYERYATVKSVEDEISFIVHFLEFDEYLENNTQSQKRSVGDVLEGEMFIGFVVVDKEVDAALMHRQFIPGSSHIEAIVQVHKIIDDYSVLAYSSLVNEKILVEFEYKVNYQKGDVIYLEGSLEMNCTNY